MWRSGIQFKVYQDILAGKIKLPNLPDTTMKLRHTLANPNFRVKDLLPPLHANPEIASVIMQAANSTAFYGTRPSSDLNGAIIRLGTTSVTSIVLTHSMETTFVKRSLPSRHVIRALWQENLRIGSLSSAIASRIADYGVRVDADLALLAGSMYHVGTLMLLSYLQNNKMAVPSPEEIDDIPSQISSNIGVVLAKHWQMDEQVVNCIRHRDQFEELTSGPFNLVDVFQFATLIHRIRDKNDLSLPQLEKTVPVKKAALHGILGESLDHFVTLVDAKANLLLNTLSGKGNAMEQPPVTSAADRYGLTSQSSTSDSQSSGKVTPISAARRYCA
ncbi:HDOD domain-containing protein [Litoribrevibacter euphylliae]|uniref:HDOD domain-containing protein n=1 Tax=Litoribrevibacter euphylliae TaxID=1834034 RepID=A0ABV7HMK2_9GAMM